MASSSLFAQSVEMYVQMEAQGKKCQEAQAVNDMPKEKEPPKAMVMKLGESEDNVPLDFEEHEPSRDVMGILLEPPGDGVLEPPGDGV